MIGKRIQQVRKQKRLSLSEMARAIGVSKRTLGYYEAGEREPVGSTCVLIAELCHIDINYLLTGSPSLEVTEAPEGIPRTLPEKPPLEALSNTIRLQEDLLKSKDETIHLQRELLAAHKSINEKENTVSNLEARLQKLEESSKELEKLREENTSLKKEIAAQEGLGEGESQLAS